MPATLTRRTLRRARLGGRHSYRAVVRHRVAVLAVAAVAALSLGTAVAVGQEAPPTWGPLAMQSQPHSPMHQPPMPDGPWFPHHR
jgi:hypothetical protein